MNGIILAGGKSSRFGQNKAFANLGNQLLIESMVALFRQIFRKIYIVTNSPREYEYLGTEIVGDIFKDCGPLSGIHAGLLASDSPDNFVAACDMPFLNIDFLRKLQQEAGAYDLVVPKSGGKLQMLHAFYSKDCLPFIEKQLQAGNLKLSALLSFVSSKIIEPQSFGQSFMNINTQTDYREALALAN